SRRRGASRRSGGGHGSPAGGIRAGTRRPCDRSRCRAGSGAFGNLEMWECGNLEIVTFPNYKLPEGYAKTKGEGLCVVLRREDVIAHFNAERDARVDPDVRPAAEVVPVGAATRTEKCRVASDDERADGGLPRRRPLVRRIHRHLIDPRAIYAEASEINR